MNWPSKKEVKKLREKYSEGTLIKIIEMNDPNPVPPGTIGKVTLVDDIGNIHLDYITYRSGLAIIPSKDKFEIIDKEVMFKELAERLMSQVKCKGYQYYPPPRVGKTVQSILNKCIMKEQRRLINCWDRDFDKSPEASIKRIMNDFKKMMKE